MAIWTDLDHFLREHADRLSIGIAESSPGNFDVVLRLDGTYGEQGMAEEQVDFLRRELGPLLRQRGIKTRGW